MATDRFAEEFGDQLKCVRERAGLTQEEVAMRADLNRTAVTLYEKGLRAPRLEAFLKLAGALEVEPQELVGPIRWEPTKTRKGTFRYNDA
jgi:transcriptional regulator with XRE-family HTH domain